MSRSPVPKRLISSPLPICSPLQRHEIESDKVRIEKDAQKERVNEEQDIIN